MEQKEKTFAELEVGDYLYFPKPDPTHFGNIDVWVNKIADKQYEVIGGTNHIIFTLEREPYNRPFVRNIAKTISIIDVERYPKVDSFSGSDGQTVWDLNNPPYGKHKVFPCRSKMEKSILREDYTLAHNIPYSRRRIESLMYITEDATIKSSLANVLEALKEVDDTDIVKKSQERVSLYKFNYHKNYDE